MTDVLYGAQGSRVTTSNLYTIDPATGVTTSVGPIGYSLTALAFDPTTGILYGLTSSRSAASPHSLITINTSTGAGTLVGLIGSATPDADFNSSGQLYTLFGAVGGGSGHPLVSINKATGAPTTIGAPGFRFGSLAFNGASVLYTLDNDTVPPHLATLNTSTGAGTVGALVTAGTAPQGAASFDSAGLLWFTDNAFFSPNLYSIDVGVTNRQTYHSTLDREIDAIAWFKPPPAPATDLQNAGGDKVASFILTVTNNTNVDPSGGDGGLRFFEGYQWRFVVTDLELRATTWAEGLWRNRQILRQLNQPGTITADLDPDDFRVNGVFDDLYRRVAQSNRLLWCWRRDGITAPYWNLRAAGIIMQPDDEGEADIALTHLSAYDPWKYLEGRPCMDAAGELPPSGGVVNGFQPLGLTGDQIALEMLANTINNEGGVFIDAGVAYGGTASYGGTLETTDAITMTINAGMSVADCWNQLVSSNNMDIVLTPIWDPSRTITVAGKTYHFTHELNIYKLAGKYRPNARFTWDRLNRSAANIDRMHDAAPGAFFDKVQYYAGQGGFPVPALGPLVNTAALNAFGSYWSTQFFPSESNATLDGALTLALARQALELAKQGSRTVTITTVPERSPIPIIAYDTADFVPVYASARLRAPIDGYQRVQTVPIAIDDEGIETVRGLVLSPSWRGSSDDLP